MNVEKCLEDIDLVRVQKLLHVLVEEAEHVLRPFNAVVHGVRAEIRENEMETVRGEALRESQGHLLDQHVTSIAKIGTERRPTALELKKI